MMDQIERVIGLDSREIDLLGEDQRQQDEDRAQHLPARQTVRRNQLRARLHARKAVVLIPDADIAQDRDRQQRHQREPRDGTLAETEHDRRRANRSQRLAEIAADLEQRLREAIASARSHAGDARGFRVERRRTKSNQRRGGQQQWIGVADRKQQAVRSAWKPCRRAMKTAGAADRRRGRPEAAASRR